MREPFITFAVPVYNGEQTVGETLLSLLDECDSSSEVIVLDNCSTDRTPEIVKDLQATYANLSYFKNDENVGYDRNFHQCMLRAKGQYVWLVGDDDLVRPGALTAVRDVLRGNPDLGFIYVNYAIVNRKTNNISTERDLKIYEDQLFEPGLAAVKALCEYPNFISSMVFLREAWLREPASKYNDTLYIQYGVFLHVTGKMRSFSIAQPYVENKCRINNVEHKPDFYKNYMQNFVNLLTIIEKHEVFSGAEADKRTVIEQILSRHFLKYVKLQKIMGGPIPMRQMIFLLKTAGPFPRYWGHLLLCLIPTRLVNILYRLRNRIRGRR